HAAIIGHNYCFSGCSGLDMPFLPARCAMWGRAAHTGVASNVWALSSVGLSSRLISDWSPVQVRQGPPQGRKSVRDAVNRRGALLRAPLVFAELCRNCADAYFGCVFSVFVVIVVVAVNGLSECFPRFFLEV